MKRLSLLVAAFAALLASSANAATFNTFVANVAVEDNRYSPAGAAGEDRLLITFTTSPNICPAVFGGGNLVAIGRSYAPTQFDNWVKTVTSALLSGKKLVVATYAPSGNAATNCRIRSFAISN